MIRFFCSCGKRLKVAKSDAGRTLQCPSCGATVQAPGTAPPTVSGHEALVQAMREVVQTPPEEVPVAEVVAEPPPPQQVQALAKLDALARTARPNGTAKSAARAAGPSLRGRPATGTRPGQAADVTPPAPPDSRKTLIISIGVSVLVAVLFLIVAAFIGGGGGGSRNEPPEPAVESTPQPKPRPTSRERDLHPPGELFPKAPWQK